MLSLKQHQLILYFLAFVATLRLLLAPHVGLGVDEAHYILYALHLDLSYFDHPPLVGWVEYLSGKLFGYSEFSARFPAIIIGFITSLFVYKLVLDSFKNKTLALVALLALHASFLFNALFLMLMPDTLLFVLIIPLLYSVLKVERENSLRAWLELGVILGLAGLSKYTAVLFIPPIVLYILFKKRYELFVSLKIVPAVLVALLIISPVIIWNIQHDWISFTYQSEHVVGESHIHLSRLARSLGAQFGAYNPLLVPLAFYGLYKALKSNNDLLFLSALFGVVLFSFFTYASLYKTALPHWSALFYLLFIPIGSAYTYEKSKKYIKFAISFGLIVGILAYAELGFKFIPQPDYKSVHLDIYGWDQIMQRANKQIKDPQKEVLGVSNWTLASRALFYNRSYNSKLYLVDKREDQFDLWEDNNLKGKDLILITTKRFHKQPQEFMKCTTTQQVDSFDIKLHNHIVNSIKLFKCSNFQGVL